MRIGAVILAAGASSRFGSNKLLHKIWGKSLLEWSLKSIDIADIGIKIVVTSEGGKVDHLLDSRVTWLVNVNAGRGIGTSISLATQFLEDQTDGILFLLADQPKVLASDIDRLLLEFFKHPECVIASSVGNTIRNPIIFPSRLYGELKLLNDDRGARDVAKSHKEQLIRVKVSPEHLVDIDTVEDLERLEKKFEKK
ncbi:MAG: nucleotidyltransferase family protein [Candidatus Thermoplasmatota archaeon]|nr:nucleotidyltransferase family protein [Candidatus Thermoplasmatota archaeon]